MIIHRLSIVFLVAFAPLLWLGGCGDDERSSATSQRVTPAKRGLDEQGRMQVSPEDRCPVCAMVPRDHAAFVSAIEVRGGRTFYFCGTGCMLRSWLHPEEHLGVQRDQLVKAVVKDYFGGQHVDASEVVFVVGSDIVGPMGPALVPVLPTQVETFRQRHGGRETFRLNELDEQRWQVIKAGNRGQRRE